MILESNSAVCLQVHTINVVSVQPVRNVRLWDELSHGDTAAPITNIVDGKN